MNLVKLIEVYEFAREAHGEQKRKTGERYITHPIAVANIAIEHGADEETIYACLLHDVVEDTSVKLNEIRERFGENVAFLVDAVTKESSLLDTFNKIKTFAEKDPRVLLIKLADRVHNTQSLNENGLEKTREKYKISNQFYIKTGFDFGYDSLAEKLDSLTKQLL